MPMVAFACFIVVSYDQRAVKPSAIEAVLESVGPFSGRFRQLPDNHFHYETFTGCSFRTIQKFSGRNDGTIHHHKLDGNMEMGTMRGRAGDPKGDRHLFMRDRKQGLFATGMKGIQGITERGRHLFTARGKPCGA